METLNNTTNQQLEQAAALNHTALFCHNALAVGGKVYQLEGVTFTHAGDSLESMILFPKLSEDIAAEQLDKIMEYYLYDPPRGVGCWSLDPPQTKDLGIRLLARGFQPGWHPNWMALYLDDLHSGHAAPGELQVVPDNFSPIDTIKNLPYSNENIRIFSNQENEHYGLLQRFIAKLDGRIVAQSSVMLLKNVFAAGIYHVGVLPGLRNRGIGKAVVRAACQFAKDKGYQYALLNGTGFKMYEQLGFKRLGSGITWWLVTSRLMTHPPTKFEVHLAEAIGRGDVEYLNISGNNTDTNLLHSTLTNGMTLMQLAVHCRQTDSAQWLISHGLHINPIESWDLGWKDRAAAILKEHPGEVNRQYGDSKLTMLHMAAERGDTELARLVISAKPNLDLKDKNYHSIALDWSKHLHKEEVAKIIEGYIKTQK